MGKQKYCQDYYDRLTELALIVHKLWKGGVDVSSGTISKSPEFRKLYSCAYNIGISWQEVLIASGIPVEKFVEKRGRRVWSADHYDRLTELALIVHKLWKSGVDVSKRTIQKSMEHRRLYSAANSMDIDWVEVIIAAGAPLDKFIKEKKAREWSMDHYDRLTELALVVHKLWKTGVDISSSGVISNREHRKLYSASSEKQITWQEVLVAAGIPSNEINIKIADHCNYPMDHYDRLTELAIIVHIFWKSGVEVSKSAIDKNTKYRKYIAAASYVGITWEEVLVAAGIPLEKVIGENTKMSLPLEHYERLTELALIVNKLWKENFDVSSKGILKSPKHINIYRAASNRSISWKEVLVAAGVPWDEIMDEDKTIVWSFHHYERLTELALEVHKLWKSGVDISASAILHDAEHRKLYSAASGKKIIWQEILVAAGIPTDEINIKTNVRSKYPKAHYERLTELALRVHKLWESGVDVSSKAIKDNAEHRKLISAAAWVGLNWQEVLVAAGIPLDKVMKTYTKRSWPTEHYERLTELALRVHTLWKSGLDVSSAAISKNQRYRRLQSAATFGGITWQEVLVAAGIPLDKVMKTYRKKSWPTEHYERLTMLALKVHKLWKNGVDVSSTAINKNQKYRKLQGAAVYSGITWQEVLVAAGIPLESVMRDIRTRLGLNHKS